MDDDIPYGLSGDQWSALTDDQRLILMTADTNEPLPDWVTGPARRILGDQ